VSQNDVVGLVPELTLLAEAQPGLHYARHVLLLDQPAGVPLPPVGRGRAVAAAGGWRAHVGRATLVAGVGEYVLAELALGDLRSAVVLLVQGDVEAVQQWAQTLAAQREVHVVPVGASVLRVIVSDAAQVVVQSLGADGWLPLASLVSATSGPQGRRSRSIKGEAAPTQPAGPVEPPVGPAEGDEPAPQAEAPTAPEQLPDPPAVIEVDATVLQPEAPATEQAEQAATEQAAQAEEN
jgi:hypothetical protein